jgi:hypothetical protein
MERMALLAETDADEEAEDIAEVALEDAAKAASCAADSDETAAAN